jgi:acetyl-CoA C-acetyltransferase
MPEPLAVILSACRTPIARFGGSLKDLTAVDLGALVVRDASARSKVSHSDLC